MSHSLSFDTPSPGGWRIRIAAAAVAALLSACKPAVESAQAMSGSQEAAAVSVQVARVVERNAAPESTHLARVTPKGGLIVDIVSKLVRANRLLTLLTCHTRAACTWRL